MEEKGRDVNLSHITKSSKKPLKKTMVGRKYTHNNYDSTIVESQVNLVEKDQDKVNIRSINRSIFERQPDLRARYKSTVDINPLFPS